MHTCRLVSLESLKVVSQLTAGTKAAQALSHYLTENMVYGPCGGVDLILSNDTQRRPY